MAKRRRNRRNHRHRHQNNKNKQPDVQINNSIVTTPLNRHTLVVTPIQNFETPRCVRSHSLIFQKKIHNEVVRSRSSSFIGTPRILNDSINCTNLNFLFEEKLNKTELTEKPIKVNVSTQTVYFNNTKKSNTDKYYDNMNVHSFAHIFETPKAVKVHNDISFFSPKLEDRSTPIETFKKGNNIFNMAKNLINTKKINGPTLICTPVHRKMPNYYTAMFEASEKKNRFNSINLHRFHKSISPKITRNVYVKLSQKKDTIIHKQSLSPKFSERNKGDSYTVPKSFSPIKKCTLEKSNNFMNVTSNTIYGRISAKVRTFHEKYSSKLAAKFLEICAWFGLTIKMGIVAMYKSKAAVDKKSICACEELYKTRIEELEDKLSEMSKELEKINANMSDFSDLKNEFLEMKKEFKKGVGCKMGDGFQPPPPPPPPFGLLPPPPPPPLPPPMPLSTSTPLSRIVKPRNNRNSTEKEKENGRPVISLDDILKVKLRKTGDRQPTPRIQRRNTQPTVSMDMLKQVKLRPATRTPPSFLNISNTSTSPASSLTRILSKVDTNVCREKSQFKA